MQKGAIQLPDGYIWPNGLPIAPFPLTSWLISHQVGYMCRWGRIKEIQDNWFCPGIHKISDQSISLCTTCKSPQISGKYLGYPKKSSKARIPLCGTPNEFYRFPPASGYSHCLAVVYMFRGWTESYWTRCASTTTVVKTLITEVIPHFGIPLWTESDQGTHFTT